MSINKKNSIKEIFDNYNGDYTFNKTEFGKNVSNEIINETAYKSHQNTAIVAMQILQTELGESSAELNLLDEEINQLVKDARRIK